MSIRKRLLQLGISIAAGLVVLAVCGIANHFARVHLCDRVGKKIDQLVLFTPTGLSEPEWTVHIYWTHNLHSNSMLHLYASYASICELEQILDDSLATGPDRSTIDAIWDRYAKLTCFGTTYRQRYEWRKNAIAQEVAICGLDYPYIDDYLAILHNERAKQ